MTKYDQICVLFKAINKDLYNWVKQQSINEDVSMSSFIVRSLKRLRRLEENDGEKENNN